MYEIMVPGSLGDRDGCAWINGKLVPWREIRTHVLAHGLHYASGLFDGIRIYEGRAFQLGEHISRFHEDAGKLFMNLPFDRGTLEEAVVALIKEHQIEAGYVRPIAWRGAGPLDFDPKPNPPNVALFAWSMPTFLPEGVALVLANWRRPPPNVGPWKIKATGNYLAATLEKFRARELGFGDALFLDWQGYMADVTGANVFLVIDGALHTPEPDGFFSGITRHTAIGLAKQEAIDTVVRKIHPDDLQKATEVFLTGSAAGLVSVGKIDMLDGAPHQYEIGPITRKLKERYNDLTKQKHSRNCDKPSSSDHEIAA